MAVLRLVYSWSTSMAGVSNVSSVYYPSPIFSSTQISVLGWHTQRRRDVLGISSLPFSVSAPYSQPPL